MRRTVPALIPDSTIAAYEFATGIKYPKDRRRGRTTGQVLEVIGVALQRPGRPIVFSDHYGSREATRHMARQLQDTIRTLGLRGMEVDWREYTLTFHLFE